jgi:hypothetical protein
MKIPVSKLFLSILVAFTVYCIYRPVKIVPSFLSCIVPLTALDIIILPVRLLPFVVFLFSVIYMHRRWRNTLRKGKNNGYDFSTNLLRCAPYFLGSIALVLITCDLMALSVRTKVQSFLDEVPDDVSVSINGQLTKKPGLVIGELRKIAPKPGHGSHATKRLDVEIINESEKLTLKLGRDSKWGQEYWVFYPKYRYTSKNEIGRISTNLFDDY